MNVVQLLLQYLHGNQFQCLNFGGKYYLVFELAILSYNILNISKRQGIIFMQYRLYEKNYILKITIERQCMVEILNGSKVDHQFNRNTKLIKWF